MTTAGRYWANPAAAKVRKRRNRSSDSADIPNHNIMPTRATLDSVNT
ncbi:MAG TPA: hypothetical protein VLA91_15055 [Acidimicrobiia bacterium]|nr:hypothetical protein [Acidimicrobiia bacterium]